MAHLQWVVRSSGPITRSRIAKDTPYIRLLSTGSIHQNSINTIQSFFSLNSVKRAIIPPNLLHTGSHFYNYLSQEGKDSSCNSSHSNEVLAGCTGELVNWGSLYKLAGVQSHLEPNQLTDTVPFPEEDGWYPLGYAVVPTVFQAVVVAGTGATL